MKKFVIEKKVSVADEIIGNLKSDFDGLLSTMDSELEKMEESVNEEILTAASIGLALPATMKLISKLGKLVGNVVVKAIGKKPNDNGAYQKWMDELGNIADRLHHLYLSPIEKLVGKFVKDKSKSHKIANAILHLIVAGFLFASGVSAVKFFKAKHLSHATLEGALTAIKGGEIKEYISNLF